MADEETQPNPFDGLSFGQSVLKLRDDPSLAGHFDTKFKDATEVDTLERMQLHAKHSYFKGTTAGAVGLASLKYRLDNPPDTTKQEETPVTEAANAAADRVRRGVVRNRTPVTTEDLRKKDQTEYEDIVGDLAKYEMIRDAKGFGENAAAVIGAIGGSIPTPEMTLGLGPVGTISSRLMLSRGMASASRVAEAATFGALINTVTDPFIQMLNLRSEVQEKFDWTQFALAAPIGFVIGGGLVGAGEVISNALVKRTLNRLGKEDPQFASPKTAAGEEPFEIKPKEVAQSTDALPIERKKEAGKLTDEQERPAGGVAEKPVDLAKVENLEETPEVKSLHKQVQDLEENFGVSIREGRVRMKDALGVFNPNSGVVRVREYPDFEVAVHEVAHAMEQKVGPELTTLTKQFSSELDKLDYATVDLGGGLVAGRTNEGFAEWLRMFIGNPAAARLKAPGFTSSFLNFMEKNKPEELGHIIKTAKAYRDYLDASSGEALASTIRQTEDLSWHQKAVQALSADQLPSTITNVVSKFYDGVFDRASSINRTMRAIAVEYRAQTGLTVKRPPPGSDPDLLWRKLQRSGAAAMAQAEHGIVPYRQTFPEGPSMTQILTVAHGDKAPSRWGSWDPKIKADFDEYLVAKVGRHYWDEFNAGRKVDPPLATSQGDLVKRMEGLDKKYPQFDQASQLFNQFSRNMLKKAYDARLEGMTDEAYNKIIQQPFYAPLNRVMEDKPLTGSGGTGQFVKGRLGSLRDIIPPTDQTMVNLQLLERKITENEVTRSLAEFSRNNRGGRFVEDIPASEVRSMTFPMEKAMEKALAERGVPQSDIDFMKGMMTDLIGEDPLVGTFYKATPATPRGEPIKFYSDENGMRAAVRLISGKEDEGFPLYEMLTAMPKYQQDMSLKVLSLASNALTKTVIFDPVYSVVNLFRDQLSAAGFIKGFIPGYHAITGLWHNFMQTDISRQYRQFGGVQAGAQLFSVEEAARADLASLAKRGYIFEKLSSFKGLGELITSLEMGTRLSAYELTVRDLKKHGLSDYDAMNGAASLSSDLLDFGRYGSRFEVARAATPFINPWMQSIDLLKRRGFEPIIRGTLQQIADDPLLRKLDMKKLQDFASRHGTPFDADEKAVNDALRFWLKLGVAGYGMGFGWAAINWRHEAYRDARPETKGTNFLFVTDDKIYAAPKNWELSLGFTAGEASFAKLMHDDPRAGEMLLAAAFEVLKPPIPLWSNPALKGSAELSANYNYFTKRPIVPERIAGRAPEYQFTPRTSIIAEKIGKVTGISPMKIDHAIGAFSATWGRNARDISKGFEDENELGRVEDWSLLRRFIKDPQQVSEASDKFWEKMAKTTGTFPQAVTTYDDLVKMNPRLGNPKEFFNKLPAQQKAWVTLWSSGKEDGKASFNADEHRLHPLSRATDAVRELNKARVEIEGNTFESTRTKEPIILTREQRQKLSQIVSMLSLKEMRNALVIMKEPGYEGRELFDLAPSMAQIEAVSPQVSAEIARRYATKKIYKTDAVAERYQEMQQRLLSEGSKANIKPLAQDMVADGYEFGAERGKRQLKKRTVIEGVQ